MEDVSLKDKLEFLLASGVIPKNKQKIINLLAEKEKNAGAEAKAKSVLMEYILLQLKRVEIDVQEKKLLDEAGITLEEVKKALSAGKPAPVNNPRAQIK